MKSTGIERKLSNQAKEGWIEVWQRKSKPEKAAAQKRSVVALEARDGISERRTTTAAMRKGRRDRKIIS